MKSRFIFLLLGATLVCNSKVTAQQTDSLENTFSVSYDYFHFDSQSQHDWHITGFEYKRQTKLGAVIGRANYANRFGKSGWQGEAEAYPKFSPKTYGYINFAYSGNVPVFPKLRSGASLFVNLPGAWELEGGFRYLYFDKSVWVGTAGLSKYLGQWLFNIRSFVSESATGVNHANFLTGRRYFGARNNYVWLQLGSGISPDENRNVQLNLSNKLSSKRIGGGLRYHAGKRHILATSIGYARDEYLPKTYGNQMFGNFIYGLQW